MELQELVQDLDRGFRNARSSAFYRALGAGVFTLAFTVIALADELAYAPVVVMGLAASIVALVRFSDQPAVVLESVEYAPETILDLRLSKSGVVICTRTSSALCEYENPPELMVRLARRCPAAAIKS